MYARRVLISALLPMALVAIVCALLAGTAAAQTLVSGDITGIVTDQSGAVVPNATVTLKQPATGLTHTTKSNSQGVYRFSLLAPGSYTVSTAAPGFQTTVRNATVTVGQATTANVQMAISSAPQTVEVTAESGIVQTENGNIATTFTPAQIANVPNPGNDLSYLVQSAPGAVMNTQAGYGNSAMFGIPATSNLFTVNGMNENDPFLNLNNSGATNLLLGQNDVQEVTVVNNGYTGQYGQMAGANVNYVTKSGTNAFHGNAQYFWNGRIMNANSYFNNAAGVPRAFDNVNQWAASFGGPIRKDKTFFFIDTEGLRVVLPTSAPVNIPSPQFQAYTLASIGAADPTQLPFYNQMFTLWNGAKGASGAANILPQGTDSTGAVISGPGCGSFTGFGDTTTPCALQFRSTAGNFTHEWLLTGRVDQIIGSNDRAFIHFRTDHGLQATYTDPISPVFDAQSVQPQYEGQLNETHTFGANAVNQFILSGSWYSAIFNVADPAAATALIPYRLRFSGGAFYDLGDDLNDWPQGRNTTQYQISDDFSLTRGAHSLKFGFVFRRNDATDYDPGFFSTGEVIGETLSDFTTGTAGTYVQSFPVRLTQPVALYGLGFYGQDEWKVSSHLSLTLALRAEHDSNPVCQTNCFARLAGSFESLSHDPSQPYNQSIITGLHQALPAFTKISWQPRLGFAWSPMGSTVLRGGIGLFSDIFPATVTDNFMNNPPLDNQFVVGPGPLAPTSTGNVMSQASGANASLVSGFASGANFATLSATNPYFVAPSVFNSASFIHAPQFQEWNLELQQGLGQKMSISLNYVGNHSIWEPVQNAGLNGYCDIGCLTAISPTGTPTSSSFAGLPTAAPDSAFGSITEVSSANVSNYNGLTASFQRRFSNFEIQANYTWSHALDEISNAGFLPYNFGTNESILNPQDPYNLRAYNYGNADYDVRNYFSLNYVWTTPRLSGFLGAIANWTIAGTLFARSGLPFTAIDSSTTGVLNGYNYATSDGYNVFANYPAGTPIACTSAAVTTPCFGTQFSPALTGFGLQRRNQLYGPKYFDTDLTVMKNFKLPHWEASKFGVGLQFFNLFNHPNFDQPIGDVDDSQFGTIVNTVSVPTSILGSFLGGDASPRLIQLKASLTF